MTWRSIIKGKAHDMVTRLYNIGKHRTTAENQAEAEALIKGAVFLRNGIDNEVCSPLFVCLYSNSSGFHKQHGTSSAGHTGYRVSLCANIARFCLPRSIFSQGSQSCCVLGGNSGTVSLYVLAYYRSLSGCPQLCAALDEYVQTGNRQDRAFEYSGYSKVFAGLLNMQWQIDADEKHAAKTKLIRVAWAQGRYVTTSLFVTVY